MRRRSVHAIRAGVIAYPKGMHQQILDIVKARLAGIALLNLDTVLSGIDEKIEKISPSADFRVPFPKLSPAVYKALRESASILLDTIDQWQTLGDESARNVTLMSKGRWHMSVLDVVVQFQQSLAGKRHSSLFGVKPTLNVSEAKKNLNTVARLKAGAMDAMPDDQVEGLATVIYAALAMAHDVLGLGGAALDKASYAVRRYVQDVRSVGSKRAAGETRDLGSFEKKNLEELISSKEKLLDFRNYLLTTGAVKEKQRKGQKRISNKPQEHEIDIDLSDLPSRYPVSLGPDSPKKLRLHIIAAKGDVAGSYSRHSMTMEIFLYHIVQSRKEFESVLRAYAETIAHELRHMVQYIIRDSLQKSEQEKTGIGPVRPGAWRSAGTPYTRVKDAARFERLQERYPDAPREVLYYLDPIEFFPQIGSSIRELLQALTFSRYGSEKSFAQIDKMSRELWAGWTGATKGHAWVYDLQSPFYKALKQYRPEAWKRAASEGYLEFRKAIEKGLREETPPSTSASVVRRRRVATTAKSKMSPDAYRQEHGRCPVGYRYDESKGCESYKSVTKDNVKRALGALRQAKEDVKEFIAKSKGTQKKFFSDKDFRREKTRDMATRLKKAPKAFGKRLAHVAREEVEEFRDAGRGLLSVARGKKLSDHERHAIKKVAIHMAIVTAASAATATGIGIPAAMAKGVARGIIFKAISATMGRLHLGEEVSHIRHLFAEVDDIMDRVAKARSEDEAMTILGEAVTVEMAKAMEDGDFDVGQG